MGRSGNVFACHAVRRCGWSAGILTAILLTVWAGASRNVHGDDAVATRPAWTGSRVTGSPEPPLPYVLRRAYEHLQFDRPVSIHPMPIADARDRRLLWVVEQDGKIFSFDADGSPSRADMVADFTATPPPLSDIQADDSTRVEIYSLAFHPDFLNNRRVVVCYVVSTPGQRRVDGSHVASFEVSRSGPPRLLMETERTVLLFDSGGHNGCTVAFDNDGLLHISTGDVASPSPPDVYDHGQNVGDVYSAILRVDMDRPEGDLGYAIPPDNPFVNLPGARPEVYAYGFRNPWRMSFDPQTGDLWVGDVGWEAWEMVYRVRSGGNYGWPIKEGPGDTRPDAKMGPTPILPADVALPHSEAASVTGGVVYRGERLPGIRGQYVFGDWVTRKFWAAEFDERNVTGFREIAVGPVKPIAFELDHDGELLIVDYNSAGQSGIYRLASNPAPPGATDFPRRLSETGLVASTAPLVAAPGVVAYEIQAPMYRDGATAERWLAIPGTERATFHAEPQTTFDWFRTGVVLPPGTVLVQTYFVETVAGDPASRRPVETQLAQCVGLGDWNHYTYRWNDDATDADLVAAGGETAKIEIIDPSSPDGRVELNWSFAARTQCRTCHTPWRGETLGFIEPQLRGPGGKAKAGKAVEGEGPDGVSDSWTRLLDGGWITTIGGIAATTEVQAAKLVDPHDESQPLEIRARSYLHANCAHCHLNGGNASVNLDVGFEKLVAETGLLDVAAMRGDCGLDDSKLVAPGAPHRSVLIYRVAKLGSGRMPPIGSGTVDHRGVDLLSRWIAQLPRPSETTASSDTSRPVDESETRYRRIVDRLAGGLADSAQTAELLGSPSGALLLATAMAGGRIDATRRADLVRTALNSPPHIAELFEPWAAASDRVERLGAGFDPSVVLGLVGDADLGRQSFVAGRGQCAQCHQAHGQGLAVGPDLSKIATKYPQSGDLLRHIVDPSAEVAEAYRAVSLLTDDGQVRVGRVLERTAGAVHLQDASGRSTWIATDEIAQELPSPKSLMPEQLLDALTAQQAADLLAFLGELK
jgi:putative heme-binding domain-containing protein